MPNCIFTTSSVTYAMKAKQLLQEYAIPVNTLKISTDRNRKGCVYGIEFSCNQQLNVSRILSAGGIPFEEYSK